MGKKTLYIILAAVVLIALYYIVGLNDQGDESLTPGNELPIEEEFASKIVYTTDISLDAGPFEADCGIRGGAFDDCGTICEPGADICAEVCAYTCDLNGESSPVGGEEEATSTEEEATSTEEETAEESD